MKNKILIAIFSVVCVCIIFMSVPRKINASEIINLVQTNYSTITINDKIIEESNSQYLIDDFIPKLSRYAIKNYSGELPQSYNYMVNIVGKDGTEITIFDNDYIIVNNKNYEIVKGTIDFDRLYHGFIE